MKDVSVANRPWAEGHNQRKRCDEKAVGIRLTAAIGNPAHHDDECGQQSRIDEAGEGCESAGNCKSRRRGIVLNTLSPNYACNHDEACETRVPEDGGQPD